MREKTTQTACSKWKFCCCEKFDFALLWLFLWARKLFWPSLIRTLHTLITPLRGILSWMQTIFVLVLFFFFSPSSSRTHHIALHQKVRTAKDTLAKKTKQNKTKQKTNNKQKKKQQLFNKMCSCRMPHRLQSRASKDLPWVPRTRLWSSRKLVNFQLRKWV